MSEERGTRNEEHVYKEARRRTSIVKEKRATLFRIEVMAMGHLGSCSTHVLERPASPVLSESNTCFERR